MAYLTVTREGFGLANSAAFTDKRCFSFFHWHNRSCLRWPDVPIPLGVSSRDRPAVVRDR
jgi:hypothetical protein